MALDPSKKTPAFESLTSTHFMVDALVGGTSSMRAAGKSLLPQQAEELDENYLTRLNESVLVNYYAKALDAATGRVFSVEPKVADLPAFMTPLLTDLDGAGNTLAQFGEENFWHVLNHGVLCFVVDYPHFAEPVSTLRDVKSRAARSYVYPVLAGQRVAAYSAFEDGKERLTHVRFTSAEIVPSDDFMEERVVQTVVAYSQPQAGDQVLLQKWIKEGTEWTPQEPIAIAGVDQIPVVPAYGWKTGLLTGQPVLLDLAWLNVAHWQSLSKQTHILSLARVPFLHAAGDNLDTVAVNDDGSAAVSKFKVSVHAAAVTGKDTVIKWIETEGKSIAAGAEDLKALEQKMEQMSLVPAVDRTGTSTATAAAINSADGSAQLRAIALAYSQALSKVLYLMSQFEGEPAPTVVVTLDATVKASEAAELPAEEELTT